MGTYAGNPNNYPAEVRTTPDGVPRDAVELSKPNYDLADRTAYLNRVLAESRNEVPGLANSYGKKIPLNSGSAVSVFTFPVVPLGRPFWIQSSNTQDYGVVFNITPHLPNVGTIVGARARIYGASGHLALPSTLPRITLSGVDGRTVVSTSPVVIGNNSDASGSVSAYETPHEIEVDLSGAPHQINYFSEYSVTVYGEMGSNYIAGMTILAVSIYIGPVLP